MAKQFGENSFRYEDYLNVSIISYQKVQKAEAVDIQSCYDLKDYRKILRPDEL